MRLRSLSLLPVLLAAACSQSAPPRAELPTTPEKIARQKIVDLFAAHADVFTCKSFHYADKTLVATDVHIAPHPSITQDHPSATVTIKELKLVLAEDPAADRDLQLVEVNLDQPTLVRPAALRGSTEPTEVETFFTGYITDLLDKVSVSRWTTVLNLQPQLTTPSDQASAAPTEQPFGSLRAVNVHLLRIEMPPDREGDAPNAIVLSGQLARVEGGWEATVQAGHQVADAAPELAPALHVQFKLEDARILARSPDMGIPDNATALDR